MKTMPLNARPRSQSGSRAVRKLRLAGEVPANLYGTILEGSNTKLVNQNLAVSAYEVQQLIDKHAQVLEVSYEDKKELVQLTEVQRDAFGDSILHVDLRIIDPNKPMKSTIGLIFKGEAAGTKTGGMLQTAVHTLDIVALPRDTPTEILVEVSALEIHDSIHVSDLTLPEGVTARTNAHQLIVQVVPPVAEEEEEPGDEAGDGAAASAEPEVISKGKKDEEE